jgi:hypothetical protein
MPKQYPDEDLGAPDQVTLYRGYAVYADYDANAPDTEDLLFCATVELAQAVCEVLNEDPRRWGNLAFVDGYEWSKSFGYRAAYAENPAVFGRSVAQVMANVEDDGEEEEEEEEEEDEDEDE